jgi:hypothetical protein
MQNTTIDARFSDIYNRLAAAWYGHQNLRLGGSASVADLAASSAYLQQARDEMWAWWRENRISRG